MISYTFKICSRYKRILLLLPFVCIIFFSIPMPAFSQEDSAVRFVVFGHVYPDYDALKESIEKVNTIHPDFVVFLGDTLPNHHQTGWNEVLAITQNIEAPVYFVPGNHDIADRAGDKRLFAEKIGPLFQTFTVKGIEFVTLNTTIGAPSGAYDIDFDQLRFLEQVYRNTTKKKIVLVHHCLFSQDNGSLCNNRGQLISLENNWNHVAVPLIADKTLAVFTGDVGSRHPYYAYTENGVSYYGVGFAPDQLEYPAHFLSVEIAEDALSVKPVSIRDDLTEVNSLFEKEQPPSFRESVGRFSYERVRMVVIGRLKEIAVLLAGLSFLLGCALSLAIFRLRKYHAKKTV